MILLGAARGAGCRAGSQAGDLIIGPRIQALSPGEKGSRKERDSIFLTLRKR